MQSLTYKPTSHKQPAARSTFSRRRLASQGAGANVAAFIALNAILALLTLSQAL